jgi:hypothetical protein
VPGFVPHWHAPYAVPSALQTWPPSQAPTPIQATDWPGVQAFFAELLPQPIARQTTMKNDARTPSTRGAATTCELIARRSG